jgi:predicted phage baseplate assembly protein
MPSNRPGLQALDYRVGTHASFFTRMLQRLATETVPLASDPTQFRPPPLAPLTTRSTDDPAIALVDAWATVGDVLTFYQERIANEGFLRTATERQSILELARAIGYELNPGVAANALLAFTVEDAAGAPGRATLDSGLKVLSIPGQNERPQTFETVENVEVRAEWNVLRPRTTEPQAVEKGATELFLRGIANQLQPGDAVVLCVPERRRQAAPTRWDFRILRTVEVVPPTVDLAHAGYTRVTWQPPLGEPDGPTVAPSDDFDVFVLRQRAALFGYNAPDYRAMPADIKAAFEPPNPQVPTRVPGPKVDTPRTEWPGFAIANGTNTQIDLDAIYPRILADSWVVLTRPGGTQLYHVDNAEPAARTDFTLSAKVTRLTLASNTNLTSFGLRETQVLAQSEQLALAERPATAPVGGGTILLDRLVDGLHAGQRLVLTGRPAGAGASEPPVSEAATIDSVVDDGPRTSVNLVAPLQNRYEPSTLTMNANVARATHGETVRNEVLGSGQGGTPNQRFSLRKPPLTYVSASTPSGTQSTLVVRVDGVLWQEVPSLFGLGPRDQKYVVRIQDDGQTDVIFGDGTMGTRLPSGTENVAATYRDGIGLDGNVRAGSLALLQVRPLGIRGVSNPIPASGAAAAENLDDARANAPLTVLTLDRIVSLRDFEDFARAFAGVGKAQATRLWDGRAHLAHITVGGVGGGPVDPVATLPNLQASIESGRDPVHAVLIQSYTPWAFGVVAEVLVDARYVAADVLAAATAAMSEAFSFAQRSFGQAVSAAEVVTVIQAVAGVQAVSLRRLYFVRPALVSTSQRLLERLPERLPEVPPGSPPAFLPAAVARWDGSQARPAELILIDPRFIALTEMQPPT